MLVKSLDNKNLFCQQYWHKVLKNNKEVPNVGRFDFADVNDELMGFNNYYLPSGHLESKIKNNDLAQKLLSKPAENDITLWRGITRPNERYKYAKNMFEKCSNLKSGDVFYMPEYSFWSENKKEAMNYANKNGIIYELKISKGTNILQRIYPIFQRASRFLCIKNTFIAEGNNKLNYITLNLLSKL